MKVHAKKLAAHRITSAFVILHHQDSVPHLLIELAVADEVKDVNVLPAQPLSKRGQRRFFYSLKHYRLFFASVCPPIRSAFSTRLPRRALPRRSDWKS